jgi:hypothetical protein
VFSFVSIAVADHASSRMILRSLVRLICVNCFLSTNLSSFLLPGCRLLLLLYCLVLYGMLAAWFIVLLSSEKRNKTRENILTSKFLDFLFRAANSSTPKMPGVNSSETLIHTYQTTWCLILEDHIFISVHWILRTLMVATLFVLTVRSTRYSFSEH